jgi:hypothetical protein
MRRVAIIVVIGASLTGCTMHAARTDDGQGYALFNDKAQKQFDDKERAQAQSARNFAQPMGWWW